MDTSILASRHAPVIAGECYLAQPEGSLKAPYGRKKNNLGSQMFSIAENPFSKPFGYSVVGPKPAGYGLVQTAYAPDNFGVFLHGGPGSTIPSNPPRCFSQQTCVLVPEQRRAHTVPLEENTTWHLVDDVKAMLDHYNVDKATFYGSSWGGYVALAFASRYPDRVTGVVGTCLATPNMLEWILSPACGNQTPLHMRYYTALQASIADLPGLSLMEALFLRFKEGFALLTEQGEAAFLVSPAAKVVKTWLEYSVAIDDARERDIGPELEKVGNSLVGQCPRVLLQMHYARHGFFTQPQGVFLRQLEKLRGHVPVTLMFGESDMVTHRRFSRDIALACDARVVVVEGASHNYTPLFVHGIIEELERMSCS